MQLFWLKTYDLTIKGLVVLFENQFAVIEVKLIIFIWFNITLVVELNYLEIHNDA